MERHQGELRPVSICPECSATFARKYELKRHSLTHLKGKEREAVEHKCPFEGCKYRSLQKQNLTVHVNSVHKRTKVWECIVEGCTKVFYDPSSRIRHEKTRHKLFRSTRRRCFKLGKHRIQKDCSADVERVTRDICGANATDNTEQLQESSLSMEISEDRWQRRNRSLFALSPYTFTETIDRTAITTVSASPPPSSPTLTDVSSYALDGEFSDGWETLARPSRDNMDMTLQRGSNYLLPTDRTELKLTALDKPGPPFRRRAVTLSSPRISSEVDFEEPIQLPPLRLLHSGTQYEGRLPTLKELNLPFPSRRIGSGFVSKRQIHMIDPNESAVLADHAHAPGQPGIGTNMTSRGMLESAHQHDIYGRRTRHRSRSIVSDIDSCDSRASTSRPGSSASWTSTSTDCRPAFHSGGSIALINSENSSETSSSASLSTRPSPLVGLPISLPQGYPLSHINTQHSQTRPATPAELDICKGRQSPSYFMLSNGG